MARSFPFMTGRSLLPSSLRISIAVLTALTGVAVVAFTGDLHGWRHAHAVNAATRSVLIQTRLLLTGLEEAESGERGFLLTGREDYLQPLRSAEPQVPVEAAALVRDAQPFPGIADLASALAAASRFRLQTLQAGVALARGPGGTGVRPSP